MKATLGIAGIAVLTQLWRVDAHVSLAKRVPTGSWAIQDVGSRHNGAQGTVV